MLSFFTLHKKPKLYNIAVLTAIVLLVCFVISRQKNVNYHLIHLILMFYLFITIVIMFYSFIMQLKYNPYSYNSIYYIGFALYLVTVLLEQMIALHNLRSLPGNDITIMLSIFSYLAASASNYMLYSFPLILIFSVCLIVSNIVLIKNEGFSFTNLLGIILSFLLVGGEIFIFTANYYFSGSELEVMIHEMMVYFLASIYLYFECMVIGGVIVSYIVTHYRPSYDKDFIIVLGCGIDKDGKPLPLLRGRIDKALSFYNEQIKHDGKVPVFITSGGRGDDEVIAESTVMKNYLISRGIDKDNIIEENRSTDTYENMLFSKEIIDIINKDGKIIYSTSDFHVFRSGIKARRAGMYAEGIGSKTKWYFWPNAMVREFVGLISQHRIKQSMILVGMIIIYMLLTYVRYITY